MDNEQLQAALPREFEVYGFLDPEIPKLRSAARDESPEWFELVDRSNKLAQESLYNIKKVKKHDFHGAIQTLLFLYILRNYQASIMCLETGLLAQAIILIRSMMEALFKQKAIHNDGNNLEQYNNEAILDQIKFGETTDELYRNGDNYMKKFDIQEIRDRLKDLQKEKKNKGYQRWDVKKWAVKADMYDFYQKQYQLFCLSAHATAGHLNEYITSDKYGLIEEFNPLPQYGMLSAYLHTNINCLLMSLNCVSPYIKKVKGKENAKTRVEHIRRQVNRLAQKRF